MENAQQRGEGKREGNAKGLEPASSALLDARRVSLNVTPANAALLFRNAAIVVDDVV